MKLFPVILIMLVCGVIIIELLVVTTEAISGPEIKALARAQAEAEVKAANITVEDPDSFYRNDFGISGFLVVNQL